MVKVFCSSEFPCLAEGDLQKKIDSWIAENPYVKIINIHTNSNKYGWMIVIQYE